MWIDVDKQDIEQIKWLFRVSNTTSNPNKPYKEYHFMNNMYITVDLKSLHAIIIKLITKISY